MYYTLQTPSLLSMEPPVGNPSASRQLIILLHGVGAQPGAMLGMAEAFRATYPEAVIAIPPGTQLFEAGGSHQYQWFSINGVTENNRHDRVAAAMPSFISTLRNIQETTLIPPADTVLAGFSQGAIMALEACAATDGLAGRVLSFSGRYARLPETAPKWTSISFYHGDQDEVISVEHAKDAFEHLHELGADVTLDIAHGAGHQAHPALVAQAIDRLKNQLPARLWKQALSGPPR
jgi:phospholipase/carboxylesterase